MAPHPAPVTRTDERSAARQPRPDAVTPAGEVTGNAGPDCFWSGSHSRVPAPRITVTDSLDQLPRPPRPQLWS